MNPFGISWLRTIGLRYVLPFDRLGGERTQDAGAMNPFVVSLSNRATISSRQTVFDSVRGELVEPRVG
jgi:hypothetical protein